MSPIIGLEISYNYNGSGIDQQWMKTFTYKAFEKLQLKN